MAHTEATHSHNLATALKGGNRPERLLRIERARRAFGDALATRVNMNTRLGDVPVQALREAMAEALEAADGSGK